MSAFWPAVQAMRLGSSETIKRVIMCICACIRQALNLTLICLASTSWTVRLKD
jgi:hypothetical protein